MGTTLSTLSNLAIYIGLVVVGAFLGSRKALRSRPLAWVGKLQFAALMILIVTLGINLGANDEVVSSLGQIGLAALVITVLAMAGSLLCLTLLRRFVLKLDHYGLPRGSEAAREEEAHHGGKADNSLTFLIVIAVVLGMLAGRFVLPAAVTAHCGTVISFGLYLLLFMVGMDMGKQGTLLADIKTGLRRPGRPLPPTGGEGLHGRRLRPGLVLPGPHPAGPLLPVGVRRGLPVQRDAGDLRHHHHPHCGQIRGLCGVRLPARRGGHGHGAPRGGGRHPRAHHHLLLYLRRGAIPGGAPAGARHRGPALLRGGLLHGN